MESNSLLINKYTNYLDALVKAYEKFQKIILVVTCDVLLSDYLNFLRSDPLVNDTIKIMKKLNYDFELLLNPHLDIKKYLIESRGNENSEKFYIEAETYREENLFINLSDLYRELIYSDIIDDHSQSQSQNISDTNVISNPQKIRKANLKKSYEVNILSNYLTNILECEKISNLIEMGCGKSYLTDDLLINEDLVYIGIDKKDELVENNNIMNKTENIYTLNYFVTVENFNEIYINKIEDKLNKKYNQNILLFGLHTCANLTSDTVKIFVNNKCFTHLVIIGCCLHALKEYITPDARDTQTYKDYIDLMGYDNKGNFLELTVLYNYEFEKIGYPLSKYIINNHPKLFLSRSARNSSMMTFPKKEEKKINSKNNVYHKKFYYRNLLQVFFELHVPQLKLIYGYGEIKIKGDDNFSKYLRIAFSNIYKIFENRPEIVQTVRDLNDKLTDQDIDNFCKLYDDYEDYVWAVYLIRLKFCKIVEYIIALDRIIYLHENGINNSKIIRIFEENKSVRNLLIYSSK